MTSLFLSKHRPKASHVVATIHFLPKTNDGPCDCSCGAPMLASQFSDHRKAIGLPSGTLGAGAARVIPTVWNKGPCSVIGCGRSVKAAGYCAGHYSRMQRGASMDKPLANYGVGGR